MCFPYLSIHLTYCETNQCHGSPDYSDLTWKYSFIIILQQLERHESEIEGHVRQQFSIQIETFQRDIKNLQDQVNTD